MPGTASALLGPDPILSTPSAFPGAAAALCTQRGWTGASCLQAAPLPSLHTGTLCTPQALPGPFHKHSLFDPLLSLQQECFLGPGIPCSGQGFAVPRCSTLCMVCRDGGPLCVLLEKRDLASC